MNLRAGTGKRPYRMRARAAAAAGTRRRIVAAVLDLHGERYHDQISLEDIAERAGVTVPTVLRHFTNKDGLLEAAADQAETEVREQRWEAPVGDVSGAIDNLLDHYEDFGPTVLRLLAQEERVPQFKPLLDRGRAGHREWVERTFAPVAAHGEASDVVTKVAAITDVYVWKLLALDRGLDRARTHALMVEMVDAVLSGGRHA